MLRSSQFLELNKKMPQAAFTTTESLPKALWKGDSKKEIISGSYIEN